MKWKELWGVEVESSKSVSLRISVSEGEDTAKVLSIRKWVQRGAEKYPTKDGFAIQITSATLNELIKALETARDCVIETE
ncbi:MAG TPA: hypothetical protein VEB88_00405 [Candidatus Acidoferrales bacterium]|nr:hypothetical protein [Candidatus Acidoferrales bacterium]